VKAHGGDVYRAIEETGMAMSEIVDFSASINPLGMPASVIDAIRKGIPELVHYPDPFADRLAVRIAKRLGIAERALLCGNGSTELIYLLVRAFRPRKVLMPQPTFSEYERACRLQEAEIEPFPLSRKRGFAIDRKAFTAAMKGRDMAFLCNPNNPTGSIMERESVLKIAEHARSSGCRLVVDEAFIDFIPEHTIVREASETGSLIVLRSLTKFYALSGLRAGAKGRGNTAEAQGAVDSQYAGCARCRGGHRRPRIPGPHPAGHLRGTGLPRKRVPVPGDRILSCYGELLPAPDGQGAGPVGAIASQRHSGTGVFELPGSG
jgi:histidinol-phosphate/aromatic aminotransferase/cobyric acid decarboxylase-like protein